MLEPSIRMKTIVILHGWGHSQAHWEGISHMLSTENRVVVFDLPGFGDEPAPPATWGVPEYAEWVNARIAKEGLRDVVLLGHSFGGRISALLAAEQPAWLRGVVLYGAPCLYRPFFRVRVRNFIGKMIGKLPIPESFRRAYRGDEENAAMEKGMRPIFRRVVAFDETEQVRQIRVPVALVWGEHDMEAPMHIAEELKALIPNAELHVLQGGGHSVHLEQPTLFYGIIKKFLQRLA